MSVGGEVCLNISLISRLFLLPGRPCPKHLVLWEEMVIMSPFILTSLGIRRMMDPPH